VHFVGFIQENKFIKIHGIISSVMIACVNLRICSICSNIGNVYWEYVYSVAVSVLQTVGIVAD